MLPFAVIDAAQVHPVVLLSLHEDALYGFQPFDGSGPTVWAIEPQDVLAVVSTEPAAVFSGVHVAWAKLVQDRAVANRARGKLPKFVAKGHRFPVLPQGVLSGFPMAAPTILKHRHGLPSEDTIRMSALFAVSTVRTTIEQAELSYQCFGKLYRERDRTMPPIDELKSCFRGLQNTKAALFQGVARYAEVILESMELGLRDRELRSHLALDTELPNGLGLAKLSFTLALLGQDTICLDARLLSLLLPQARKRDEFMGRIGKAEGGRVTERALLTYEAMEDAFLHDNPNFDPTDPIGRARAQWLSWEAVGGKGASHSVWLDMLADEED